MGKLRTVLICTDWCALPSLMHNTISDKKQQRIFRSQSNQWHPGRVQHRMVQSKPLRTPCWCAVISFNMFKNMSKQIDVDKTPRYTKWYTKLEGSPMFRAAPETPVLLEGETGFLDGHDSPWFIGRSNPSCPEIILETHGDPKLSMVHPKLSGFLTCECNRHRIKDAKVEKTMVTICHILPKPMSKGRWWKLYTMIQRWETICGQRSRNTLS